MKILPTHPAFAKYEAGLATYAAHGATNEGATLHAFRGLLQTFVDTRPGWALLGEQTVPGRVRFDGIVQDQNFDRRGVWEAKDPDDDLEKEIAKKIKRGYPLDNIIFEDTRHAVLYQSRQRETKIDLRDRVALAALLMRFFDYREPDPRAYTEAVGKFKERIPEIAQGLQRLIATQRETNLGFNAAFDAFRTLCRGAIDPGITDAALDEMLVQHLLTERLFRTVFNNPEFTRRNAIAAEIEKVIARLTSKTFSRDEFLQSLGKYFYHIEDEARNIHDWGAKQALLNDVYERFFQGYSTKQADTHGIVYTPQEIVEFMCRSVAHVLETEFGKNIGDPDVVVLDPATGTGNFIVNLIRHHIPTMALEQKYAHGLFANEIMLLPYYIASQNIEHAYFERAEAYTPFTGLCFADTLDMAEAKQMGLAFMSEANTERVAAEKAAPINVIIGNPPYNVGQKNENDNNKNRRYPVIDKRIKETYGKDSRATLQTKIYDAYVKFFRWASDRLGDRDGIVCMVTNNSFVDQNAFDGMRKHLLQDFTHIWHLDLHGNVRQNPKLSGTTHNVFGIQVGVGITIAVRKAANSERYLYYHRVPEDWRKTDKLAYLKEKRDMSRIEWHELQPNDRNVWRTDGMNADYDAFVPLGSKEGKSLDIIETAAIFDKFSLGVSTNRDNWVYDFSRAKLTGKVKRLVAYFNAEITRWNQRDETTKLDDFVAYDDKQIKWSEGLKSHLKRGNLGRFQEKHLRLALYRPFCKQFMYFDRLLNDRVSLMPAIFPTPASEGENVCIWLKVGTEVPMFALMSNVIPDLLPQGGSQCFPLYTYNEDGTGKRENITDWALGQFRAHYGDATTKRDIFHYVYALLHHPTYRAKYAENLRRELPRVPFVDGGETFRAFAAAGEALAALHLGYESAPEYPLKKTETAPGATMHDVFHVEKMRYADKGKDKTAVVVNPALTLSGIPPEAHAYRLGNRSALDWILDQYQVRTDARSGITSDPNRPDDERYIVRLVGQVVGVSVETVRIVAGLPELA